MDVSGFSIKRALPERLCNLDRLFYMMDQRGLDGIVAYLRPNVFYFTGFAPPSAQSLHETNGTGAFFLSKNDPHHPILVAPDYDLAYFIEHPTWVKDIRAYPTLVLPLDVPANQAAFDRFVPESVKSTEWGAAARETYSENFNVACRKAFTDLGMEQGRIGFDDLRLGHKLADRDTEIVDAYGAIKFVRQIKTEAELDLLRDALALNEEAIQRTINTWDHGMTWQEFLSEYQMQATKLGGFFHDPSAIIVANPRGTESAFFMQAGTEDSRVESGMTMMLDCHGTLNHYCWDGGKSWVVDDERQGLLLDIQKATVEATVQVNSAMKPGTRVSTLQSMGRKVFKDMGIPDPDSALVFFHGLGLEHLDMEFSTTSREDFVLEEGMSVATHVSYPGDERRRYWLEDIVVVTAEGGKSLNTWGLEPLVSG
jgi:Xaa-Pro aminopeptidase